MSVYAKVNSHSDAVYDYLSNVQGFNGIFSSLIVYPDTYKVEIVPSDRYLHSLGVYSPTAGVTTQNITFPAYLPGIGFFTFGVPITISSVTVSNRGVAINPIYSDNILSWEIYKRHGWNSNTMDGYYDSANGGIVSAKYIYEGNVTYNFNMYLGAYGQVRYEYVYTPFLGTATTLHFWSDEIRASSQLTIVP